ncbi:hypothetical protein ACFV4N_18695 [Actinosynnema sp. NPDC059797]
MSDEACDGDNGRMLQPVYEAPAVIDLGRAIDVTKGSTMDNNDANNQGFS